MKFTASLLAFCPITLIGSAAATSLSCTPVAPVDQCLPIQKLFGACQTAPANEVLCQTERKAIASSAHSSKTSFGYYSAPDGYVFEPETARAVFDGRGTHGVDASISRDSRLYCLWGTASGYADGYCEARARLVRSRGG